MPDFSKRSSDIEIMDDLNCKGEVVEQTLRELDFINKWLGGDQVTLNAVDKLLSKISEDREIVIVDLGCGSGSMLAKISVIAQKRNLKVRLVGIDANPNIVSYAIRNNKNDKIDFLAIDIFSDDFMKMKFDIVIGTLFFHHFSNQQLSNFFIQLGKQTTMGIIVNDIHRHPLAYFSIKLLTGLFSKSAMVKYDAPLSVLRSFTKTDWIVIFKDAGLPYSLKWKWAFRWQLIINKGENILNSRNYTLAQFFVT